MNLSTFLSDEAVRDAMIGLVVTIILFIGGFISVRASRMKDRLKLQEAVEQLTITGNTAREKFRQDLDQLRVDSEKARLEAERLAEKSREEDRKFIREQAERERQRTDEIMHQHQSERVAFEARVVMWDAEVKRRQALYEDACKQRDEAIAALLIAKSDYSEMKGKVDLLVEQLAASQAKVAQNELSIDNLGVEVNDLRDALLDKHEALEKSEAEKKIMQDRIDKLQKLVNQLSEQAEASQKEVKRLSARLKELEKNGTKPDTGPLAKVNSANEPPTPPSIPPLSDRLNKPDVP